jgi:hypothetical protein
MIDLAFDANRNCYVDENQELAFASGHAEVEQAVETLIKSFMGEHWLDPDYGIDYENKVLTENFKESVAAREIKRKILALQGVRSIKFFSLVLSEDASEVVVRCDFISIYDEEGNITVEQSV